VPSEDVTLYFQTELPSDEELPYWLPVPDGKFEVILRIYAPDMDYFPIPYDCDDGEDDPDSACANKYVPPDLVRVEPSSSECEGASPSPREIDIGPLPRRTRKLLRQIGVDGDFLSRFQ